MCVAGGCFAVVLLLLFWTPDKMEAFSPSIPHGPPNQVVHLGIKQRQRNSRRHRGLLFFFFSCLLDASFIYHVFVAAWSSILSFFRPTYETSHPRIPNSRTIPSSSHAFKKKKNTVSKEKKHNSVVLVSAAQQGCRDPYGYMRFRLCPPLRLSSDAACISLGRTVGLSYLSVLYMTVCICSPQAPLPPLFMRVFFFF